MPEEVESNALKAERESSAARGVFQSSPGALSESQRSTSPKPWWQSRTIVSALVVALATGLQHFKIAVDPNDPALSDAVLQCVQLLGSLVAIYGRVRAQKPIAPLGLPSAARLLLATLLLPLLALTGCVGGRSLGPSIGLAVGYQGISLGVTFFSNPAPTPAAPDGKTAVTPRRS